MVITEHMLKTWMQIPQDIDKLTTQKITEVESFKVIENDPNVVIGYVLTREDHPDSDHLNVTTVNVGDEILPIVCGAANVDAGQTVIVAKVGAILPGHFEIKEATIRGQVSKGMICSLQELGFSDKVIPEAYKQGIYHFDETMDPGSSAYDALCMTGFHMELGLTPNRGDLLSGLGFAYDLSAMLNQTLQINLKDMTPVKEINPFSVNIQTKGCYKYHARVFKNAKVKPSPWWLKQVLIANDIRPINNVVDITNYVLLMMGTPLHTFDYDAFKTFDIVVRQAREHEETITLDGQTRVLTEEDVVITNEDRVIAIGGVMGSQNTMIQPTTKNIILEAALFDPKHIQKTSKRLNLRSDASLRYERGVGYDRVDMGLKLATQLLVELCEADVLEGIATDTFVDAPSQTIHIQVGDINKHLGVSLSKDEMVSYLKRYRYEVEVQGDMLTCLPPSDRYDIHIQADIIEEVGRMYGLDLIPPQPLKHHYKGGLKPYQKQIRKLKNALTHAGFQEIITYSLVKDETLENFPTFGEPVYLLMPMSEDRKLLRQSLYPGMLEAMSYNMKRQQDHMFAFEIGHVFAEGKELNHLNVVMKGRYHHHMTSNQGLEANFYLLKAMLTRVSVILGKTFTLNVDEIPEMYHPYQSVLIYDGETRVGHMGALHPTLLKSYDLKQVYGLHINLEGMLGELETVLYQPMSKFPSVTRDLAVMMPITMSVEAPMNIIKQTLRKILVDTYVFDMYQGEHVDEGMQSVAFRMVLNDPEKTLETTDVDKLMKKVMHRLSFELKLLIRE